MIKPKFQLFLLGRFELIGPKGPVDLATRKHACLLGFLASTLPAAHNRERIMTLLWGSHADAQARQNLRQALYRLRIILGPDAIIANGATVSLRSDVVACDVSTFETLVQDGSRAALNKAAALYRGRLLSDCSTSEETWQEWQYVEAQRLETMALDCMMKLGELELAANRFEEALKSANHALGISSLREDAHRLVIRSLTASGRKAEALRHCEHVRLILKAELDVEPDATTLMLEAQLRDSKPTALGPFARVPSDCSMLPLPDRPSIAVLPFANMSGELEHEYFVDGMVEDIITEISRFGELFVIARNSSFQYKGKSLDIRQVAHELGVGYVLEGSVRRGGDRLRISAQLIDAATGTHLWAERYDRRLEDVFKVQDEVVRTIVAILAAYVRKAETERARAKSPNSWQAYDYYLQAADAFLRTFSSSFQVEDLYEARRLLERSLAIDPNYARSYALLANSYVAVWHNTLDDDFLNPGALDQAHQFARKAVQLDANLPQAHASLGHVLMYKHEHESCIAAFERAIALNPNYLDWRFGLALVLAGDSKRAINVLKAYMRLNPFYPPVSCGLLGFAHFMLKEYSQALLIQRDFVSRAPTLRAGHVWLAATHARLGQLEQARERAAEVLRLQPNYSIAGTARRILAFKSPKDDKHFFDGLRKAGLPLGAAHSQ